jgi:hypothetical protein
MDDTPKTFIDWVETNPREFNERIEAGEKGNRQNPMIAARMAFNAGIHAGLAIAARRMAEVVLNRKLD